MANPVENLDDLVSVDGIKARIAACEAIVNSNANDNVEHELARLRALRKAYLPAKRELTRLKVALAALTGGQLRNRKPKTEAPTS